MEPHAPEGIVAASPHPVTPSISRATIADRRSGYVPAAVTSGSRNRSAMS